MCWSKRAVPKNIVSTTVPPPPMTTTMSHQMNCTAADEAMLPLPCQNGGTCYAMEVGDGQRDVGCICPEGFVGQFCEEVKFPFSFASMYIGIFVGLAVLIFVAIVVIFFYIRKRRQQREQDVSRPDIKYDHPEQTA